MKNKLLVSHIILLASTALTYGQAYLSSFSAKDTLGCAPLVTNFNAITPNAKSWKWDFGNGNTSILQNPTEFYSESGLYTIQLEVLYNDGTSHQFVKENYIHCAKKPEILTSVLSKESCFKSNFLDIENITLGDNKYQWDFGDGTFSAEKHAYHKYDSEGNYEINLTATNTYGCSSNSRITEFSVTDILPSEVSITSKSEDCKPANVFSLSATKIEGYSYIWSFDDGEILSGHQIEKTIKTSGNHDVMLIRSSPLGCMDTSHIENKINVLSSNYSFDLSNHEQCKDSPILFKINGPRIKGVEWDFGDGQYSASKAPAHSYKNNGKYSIKAKVMHSENCIEILKGNNSIKIGNGPKAFFSVSDTSICVGDVIDLIHNYSESDSLEWNFGDGQTSHQKEISHKYFSKGSYTITLKTKMGSCIDLFSKEITVTKPTAKFVNKVIHSCAPVDILFHNLSIDAKNYYWEVGDGIKSSKKDPSITLFQAKNYSVSLIVMDENGCRDTSQVIDAVKIANNFPTNFKPTKINGCAPLSVSFANLSLGTGDWLWEFGDGSISRSKEARHVYSSPGNSIVSMSTRNNSGCVFTIDTFAIIDCQKLEFDSIQSEIDCPKNKMSMSAICSSCDQIDWLVEDTSYHGNQYSHIFSNKEEHLVHLVGKSGLGCKAKASYLFHPDSCYWVPLIGEIPGNQKSEVTWKEIDDYVSNLAPHNSGCKPLLTAVLNPKPNAQSWLWDFGDGETSTKKNPQHLYDTTGLFSLTFTYIDEGISQTLYMNNFAEVNGHNNKILSNKTEECFDLNLKLESANTSLQNYVWTIDEQRQLNNTFRKDTILKKSNNIHLITLTTSDSNYCNNTEALAVAVNGTFPLFNFKSKLCLGDSLIIKHNISARYSAEWNFGDGNMSLDTIPNHVYNSSGKYTVSVKLTDEQGCSNLILVGDVAVSNPKSDFRTEKDRNVCVGDTIKFQSDITANQLYLWNVTNGSMISSDENLLIIVDSLGPIDISLKVMEDACVDSTIKKSILIAHDPIADFSYTTKSLCTPIIAEFINLSTSGIDYHWSFGAEKTSNKTNPIHQFSSTDSKEISLKVTDEYGCSESKFISSDNLFKAKIHLSDSFGCAPSPISFSETSLNISSWLWDFGDGISDTTKQPTHVYENGGKFDITLITENDNGCKDTTVIKSAIEVDKVIANFGIKKDEGCAPVMVEFENKSVNSTLWFWNFGNGDSSKLENPKYNYYSGGKYTVKLTAKNNNGCLDSIISPSILEVEGPYANFSIDKVSLCLGDSAHLVNKTQNADYYRWILGDGNVDTTMNISHSYQEEGEYNVMLLALDSNGCESVAFSKNKLQVHEVPKSSFIVSDTVGCSPLSISVKAMGKSFEYQWLINDSIVSVQKEFSKIFNAGMSRLELISTNKSGCTSSSKKIVNLEDFITDSLSDICQNKQIMVLDPNLSFTNWSINGNLMNSDTIKLTNLNAGIHEVIFNSKGLCLAADTSYFKLDTTFTTKLIAPEQLCSNSDPIELQASNSSGIWNGIGITDPFKGIFDASFANIGDNIISYSVKKGTCFSNDSIKVQVETMPIATFNLPSAYGCIGSPLQFAPSENIDGMEYLWIFMNKKDTVYSDEKKPLMYLEDETWQIKLQVSNQGCESKSIMQSLRVFDSLPPLAPSIIRSTVKNNNSIYTEWRNPTDAERKIEKLQVWRSMDSIRYELIATVSKDLNNYNDRYLDVSNHKYFYKITSLNKCQIEPEQSNVSSNIVLKAQGVNNDIIKLNWSEYFKWKEGVEYYEVQRKDEAGNWIMIQRVEADQQSTIINR